MKKSEVDEWNYKLHLLSVQRFIQQAELHSKATKFDQATLSKQKFVPCIAGKEKFRYSCINSKDKSNS